MLEEKLDQDLKTALLSGHKLTVNTLRSIKNAILYLKVATGSKNRVLPDDAILVLLQKEAKKRQESADLYRQGGAGEKAAQELAEKSIIESYLPSQLSEAELAKLVDETIQEMGGVGQATMGSVISSVKQKMAGAADGALIAKLTKERLAP